MASIFKNGKRWIAASSYLGVPRRRYFATRAEAKQQVEAWERWIQEHKANSIKLWREA